ncbi:hypothetical protein [Adonisia turfae]
MTYKSTVDLSQLASWGCDWAIREIARQSLVGRTDAGGRVEAGRIPPWQVQGSSPWMREDFPSIALYSGDSDVAELRASGVGGTASAEIEIFGAVVTKINDDWQSACDRLRLQILAAVLGAPSQLYQVIERVASVSWRNQLPQQASERVLAETILTIRVAYEWQAPADPEALQQVLAAFSGAPGHPFARLDAAFVQPEE